jgi:hypothetical protein
MNPSLLLIPDRYKAAKLYSQIPDSGDGDLTFARASVATRVNASGLIESVASGVPRLDYTGGGCPSLLLEPQRTNIASYNETDAGTWGATTPAASGTILGVNAYTILTNIGLGDSPHNQTISQFVANTTYTASVLVDFGFLTANFELGFLMFATAGISFRGITVDRITKAITTSGGVNEITALNSKATQIQGNIYKIELTVAISSGATSISGSRVYCHSSTSLTTARIAALQVEDGSYSTSYISKTTTASVTRLADAASKTGISSLIGQTAGTLFVEFFFNAQNNIPNGNDKSVLRIKTGVGYADEIAISYFGNEGGSFGLTIAVQVTVNGVSQATMFSPQTLTTGYHKAAFAYAVNDFVLAVDGQIAATDTSGSVPACVDFTMNEATRVQSNINPKQVALYTTRLSNAELQSLTAL